LYKTSHRRFFYALLGFLLLNPGFSLSQAAEETSVTKAGQSPPVKKRFIRKRFRKPAPKKAPQKKGTPVVKRKFQKKGTSARKTVRPKQKLAKAEDVAGSARLESARRKVEIQRIDTKEWRPASRNTILKTNEKIRTGRRSTARIKLKDGTKILILQNSRVEMENLSSIQKTIKLMRGRLRAIVKKIKGAKNFQIKTPIGVASVRGTDFEVEYLEDSEDMTVIVKSGQVGVSRLGDLANEVILNPGDKIIFGPSGVLGNPSGCSSGNHEHPG